MISLSAKETPKINNLGCGPDFLGPELIDKGLRLLGIESVTNCCVNHDICYTKCEQTQLECDNLFEKCFKEKCSKFSQFYEQFVCQLSTANMVLAVKSLGALHRFCDN